MKEVTKEVKVRKGGDVTVLNEAMWEDEALVEEQEGDSVLRIFLQILNYMQKSNRAGELIPYSFGDGNGVEDSFIDSWAGVSSIDASTSPITVNFSDNILNNGKPPGNVQGVMLGGFQGNDDLNGTHISDANRIDNNTVEISVPTTGSEDASFAKGIALFNFRGSGGARDAGDYFEDPNIFLGGSTLPNVTGQVGLDAPLVHGNSTGQIDYGGRTINTPVINLAQQISTITISRDVTNQTAADIPVEEVGLRCRIGEDFEDPYEYTFIGRDNLSTSIPAKTTVTFNYKFRTTCETTGGILVQFNELLYRQFSQGNRTVQDINNNNQNDGAEPTQFYSVAGGGDNNIRDNDVGHGIPYQHYGAQVGISTTVVDEADFGLKNRISHGNATGEIHYLGQYIGEVQEDLPNDRYYYDATRFFENVSGSTLTVNEVGYNVVPEISIADYAAMIFRHRVNPGVSIDDGETLKVVYRVSVKPKA